MSQYVPLLPAVQRMELEMKVMIHIYIQGDPKKMHHKDSDHKSVLEVRFYFSTCVSESEFRARVI